MTYTLTFPQKVLREVDSGGSSTFLSCYQPIHLLPLLPNFLKLLFTLTFSNPSFPTHFLIQGFFQSIPLKESLPRLTNELHVAKESEHFILNQCKVSGIVDVVYLKLFSICFYDTTFLVFLLVLQPHVFQSSLPTDVCFVCFIALLRMYHL